MASSRARVPLRSANAAAPPAGSPPLWNGLAALRLASGRAVGEEAFWSELLPGGYLVVFYSDDNVWHERVLLAEADSQHWVIETPDGDMYVENVACTSPEDGPCRAVALDETGELPVFLRGRTYRFKDFYNDATLLIKMKDAAELAVEMGFERPSHTVYLDALGERRPLPVARVGGRRRGKGPPLPALALPPEEAHVGPPLEGPGLALPLGDGPPAEEVGGTDTPRKDEEPPLELTSSRWVAMETRGSVKRGDDLKVKEGDKLLGDRVLHKLPDGQVVTGCPAHSLAALGDVRAAGDGADARVLSPVVYDAGGRRWSEFAAAVSRMRVEPMDDFPLEGERSALWLFQYVRDHGGTFDARQTKWAMEQGIKPDSTAFLMHDLVGLALDLSVCYDQSDGGNLASVEVLARLYQLVEETSGTLQLEGLDHYLGRDRTGGLRRGVALNPSLAAYATDKKSKETEVMKQRRKAREEEEAAKKNKGGKPGGPGKTSP